MESARSLLGIFFFALMIVDSFGLPIKGFKSTEQSGGDSTSSGSYRGHSAPMHYSSSRGAVQTVPVFVQSPVYMQAVAAPSTSSFGVSAPAVEERGASTAAVPVLSSSSEGGVFSKVPVEDPSLGQPMYTTPVFYSVPAYQPEASAQPGPGPAETQWLLAPSTFSEEQQSPDATLGLTNLLPPPPPPSGPVLQSGETSNILKEAELGNYQQQTEEFGYPADPVQPRLAYTSVLPVQGLGGVSSWWGSPYPGFDYNLLYGLYPPGTYTTFSQNHERGKDYHQSVHYLKEHVSEDQGPQQHTQQKVFPGVPQRS